ncbi:MAG TPA: hypothetical protein VFJ17_12525 [Mycobacteriales bacterium]|jgi:hypothetical protein|nr:hypothetical protein [Mycobacteriales bacterium]
MSRAQRAIATATCATALVVACDVLVFLHHRNGWPHGFGVWLEGSISLPIWLAIGLVIVLRVPGNRLGTAALAFALLDGVQLFSGALATYLAGPQSTDTSTVDWLAGVSIVAQILVVGGLVVFAQLAPDGQLVSPRWRPVTVVSLLGFLVAGIANLASNTDARDAVPAAHAPIQGVSSGTLHVIYTIDGVLVFFAIGATIAGLFVRWRRGASVERQQLKVVLYAAVTAVLLAVVVQPIANRLWPNATLAGDIMWAVIPSVLPASIAVAVLRYRLYDIDRVVSRTVSYAVVTGVVVGGYVGLVALIESVLGFSSSVAVAASTLVAAAAFQTLRRRLQRAIDRRFDRAAYDARRTVEAFAARLRDEVDVDTVRSDLLETTAAAIVPVQASVWLAKA